MRIVQGQIWIGTNGGGLNRFDRQTEAFTHYKETDGLPDNVVYGILEDGLGRLWLSTNNGLSCFDPALEFFSQLPTSKMVYRGANTIWVHFIRVLKESCSLVVSMVLMPFLVSGL